jgi:hypothetical protein
MATHTKCRHEIQETRACPRHRDAGARGRHRQHHDRRRHLPLRPSSPARSAPQRRWPTSLRAWRWVSSCCAWRTPPAARAAHRGPTAYVGAAFGPCRLRRGRASLDARDVCRSGGVHGVRVERRPARHGAERPGHGERDSPGRSCSGRSSTRAASLLDRASIRSPPSRSSCRSACWRSPASSSSTPPTCIGPLPGTGRCGPHLVAPDLCVRGNRRALVPSGEVRDTARTVPRAIALAMVGITLIYVVLQVVAQGFSATARPGDRRAARRRRRSVARRVGARSSPAPRCRCSGTSAASRSMPRIVYARPRRLPAACADVAPSAPSLAATGDHPAIGTDLRARPLRHF